MPTVASNYILSETTEYPSVSAEADLIPLLLYVATLREYRKLVLIRLKDTIRYRGNKEGKTACRVATGS